MGKFSVDGLMSGVSTSAIVDAIMAAERLPQREIKDKVKNFEKQITALQNINSKMAGVGKAADNILASKFWETPKTTSSSPSVTVSATASAQVGQVKFDVLSLAQKHTEIGAAMKWEDGGTSNPAGPANITITKAGPPPVVMPAINSPTADPRAIAQAVNSANIGFSATAVQVAPNQYRLQLQASEAGTAGAFSFTIDTTPPVASETLKQGAEAKISLGTTAQGNAIELTSKSNTFSNAFPGLSINVTKVEAGVTIDTVRDNEAIAKDVKGFVDAINDSLSQMRQATAVSAIKEGNGPLQGSGLLRQASMSLVSASTGYAGPNGALASQAGISVDRFGKITLDETKMKDLLAKDPEKLKGIMTDLATRLKDVSSDYSASSTGLISQAVKSKQGQVRGMNEQIDNWDIRLEMREKTLKRQFSAMETLMSGVKTQSSWLSSQVAGMSTQR